MGQDQSTMLQAQLERNLGYHFNNPALLNEALTHDSLTSGPQPTSQKDYQRLEFLGDAGYDFVITNYINKKFPNADKGTMSRMRADLVINTKQKEIASKLKLETFVKFHASVQGFVSFDAFLESLIGAVFLIAGGEDGRGYREAKMVIWQHCSLNTRYSTSSSSSSD